MIFGSEKYMCSSLRAGGLDLACLKGLRHEDFAILSQFCAKIIT